MLAFALTAILMACSKSSVVGAVDSANSAATKMMQPLAPADASGQAGAR